MDGRIGRWTGRWVGAWVGGLVDGWMGEHILITCIMFAYLDPFRFV